MKTYLTIILLVLFSFGCRKAIDLPDEESEKLFGTWELYNSSGPFGEIPESKENSIRRKYSNTGIVKEYKNKIIVFRTKYLFTKFSTHSSILIDVIDYNNNRPTESYEFRGNDTLILNSMCDDCYTQFFVRVK